MTEDYPRHFNTGHWRAQLVTPRYPSRCHLCQRNCSRLCYLAHGVPFCCQCTTRRTADVDRSILWARRQRSR